MRASSPALGAFFGSWYFVTGVWRRNKCCEKRHICRKARTLCYRTLCAADLGVRYMPQTSSSTCHDRSTWIGRPEVNKRRVLDTTDGLISVTARAWRLPFPAPLRFAKRYDVQ